MIKFPKNYSVIKVVAILLQIDTKGLFSTILAVFNPQRAECKNHPVWVSIPSDRVGKQNCMFDKVSETLFCNQGIGADFKIL